MNTKKEYNYRSNNPKAKGKPQTTRNVSYYAIWNRSYLATRIIYSPITCDIYSIPLEKVKKMKKISVSMINYFLNKFPKSSCSNSVVDTY